MRPRHNDLCVLVDSDFEGFPRITDLHDLDVPFAVVLVHIPSFIDDKVISLSHEISTLSERDIVGFTRCRVNMQKSSKFCMLHILDVSFSVCMLIVKNALSCGKHDLVA